MDDPWKSHRELQWGLGGKRAPLWKGGAGLTWIHMYHFFVAWVLFPKVNHLITSSWRDPQPPLGSIWVSVQRVCPSNKEIGKWIFVLQVWKVAVSLALQCTVTLMAPHLAPTLQCSLLKPSMEQESAPKQNTLEVSKNINHILFRIMKFLMFALADALPYPTTDLWTFNVAVSGKVS